ncbi:glycoside hydrolase family 130 protein [Coraliomargarita sp. SDUM461003]|uniref:Glycoside hydrolase family 130 protein n=1 Tax=Thalassobacterium maritimum TaxID=3041265 RepID=A0ABU1AV24_9BACT|nr:glycoside hydrolase family 130 protein [Coraliomargarita sp. SDUM461003]MDQ8207987.1 glycoside hydrolase family 130 protein [Coraliomargarita sp. SDUM461003]
MTTQTSPLQRHPANPVLHEDDIPWDCMSVFNAGVCKWENGYIMLFRTDSGPRAHPDAYLTRVGLARSQDGHNWKVDPEPIFDQQKIREWLKSQYDVRFGDKEVVRVYDPRITMIDAEAYFCFAVDTQHGIRGGIAKSTDLRNWDLLHITLPEDRNMVLFPERVNGKLIRLDRPFPLYLRGGRESFDIWISESPDGIHWGEHKLLLAAEEIPFGNAKIGPGAPPIRTEKGWLTTFHAVVKHEDKELFTWSEGTWNKEYIAGLMLLDLENPAKVIGMSKEPLLRAEAPYELEGFRGSVIFPGGFILEDDGIVKMYYGAADTVVALAEGKLEDLLSTIEPL